MTVTSLTAAERETVVNLSDADDAVRIWTAQRTVLTSLRRKPGHFTEVASGFHGGTEWAEFVTVTDVWSVATGAKRKGTPRPNLRPVGTPSLTVSPGKGRDARATA